MIRIAILDEKREDALKLKRILLGEGKATIGQADIVWFDSVIDFFEQYRADFDLIFLETDFSYASGMGVARRIRQLDARALLVFVSATLAEAAAGYKVSATDFLKKPLCKESVCGALSRAAPFLSRTEIDRSLVVRTASGLQRIMVSDLYYVDVCRHKLTFHTAGDSFECWGTLSGVAQLLPSDEFFRPNNYLLVNLLHVKGVRGDSVCVGAEDLKISRQRRSDFMITFERFLKKRGKTLV